MGRFFLGILTTVILFSAVFGVLFALDQGKIIEMKRATIGVLGGLPGWEDLPKIFATGKEGLKAWREKEKTYQARIGALKRELKKAQTQLEKAQNGSETPAGDNGTLPQPSTTTPAPDATGNPPNLSADTEASTKQAARLLAEMKPEAAAGILLKVPPDVALRILSKVQERKAAKIIEAMPVENGSSLLTKLAERH